jgi:hypothetical protein
MMMYETLDLFDQPKARTTDPYTSKIAAKRVKPRATSQAMKLLYAHYNNPTGLTDEEAANAAGVNLMSEFRTRMSSLVRAGYVNDTEITRPSSFGNPNIVRTISKNGMDLIEDVFYGN